MVRDGIASSHDKISIAVTTYGTQSYYTHACLESIRTWKSEQHELLVACHDGTLLLDYYLKACVNDGLIDKLIFTPLNFGHTMGVNRCFAEASGRLLFNIANDIVLGPAILDDCANRLQRDAKLGLIGWHWYHDGTLWDGDEIIQYKLRDENLPYLKPQEQQNIQKALWYTGRTFRALDGPKWLCLCNTAFFGIRRDVWNRVGGFSDIYPHYWADDFLNYAVLDQGLNVQAFDSKFKDENYFLEFQDRNGDREDQRRNWDWVPVPPELESYFASLADGLSRIERQLLYQIARSIPAQSTILHVGECGVALMRFLCEQHTLEFIEGNALEMPAFPASDVIFIDGGETEERLQNDIRLAEAAIKPNGILIFHNYGNPARPAVKTTINAHFPAEKIRAHRTLCVIQF